MIGCTPDSPPRDSTRAAKTVLVLLQSSFQKLRSCLALLYSFSLLGSCCILITAINFFGDVDGFHDDVAVFFGCWPPLLGVVVAGA